MYYITLIKEEAQKLADAQHEWCFNNRPDYRATKWGILESNNGMGYAVQLMSELKVFMRLFENLSFTQNWSIEPIIQELIRANLNDMPEPNEYLFTLLDPAKLEAELPKFQELALPEENYKAFLPDGFYLREGLL
jgi:hypothetical protein